MSVTDLPALNASLNALSTVFLTTGYVMIKQGQRARHKACMIAALVTSSLFLISYVVYHAQIGSKPFERSGPIRVVYLVILFTHVVLAITVVPLALMTLSRGLASQFERHRAIARWTFPIWLYVSVTGVVVYVMLYQM
jgi:uncharacterized membrane protein YozB (DUF420 family)